MGIEFRYVRLGEPWRGEVCVSSCVHGKPPTKKFHGIPLLSGIGNITR